MYTLEDDDNEEGNKRVRSEEGNDHKECGDCIPKREMMIMKRVGGLHENSSVKANMRAIFLILPSCSLLSLYCWTATGQQIDNSEHYLLKDLDCLHFRT